MKKILSLGIASAVCAITAISVSAAPASYAVNGEVAKDKVITIDVLAGQDVTGLAFTVDVEGLEVQDVKSPNTSAMLNKYDAATKKFMLSAGSDVVAKAGEAICTITAKVTAEAGKTISVTLTDSTGKYTAVLPDKALTETVKGAEESKPEESKPEESKPEGGDSGNDNPGTGVALAVVPAVLAAAGVIVAKKRK
ncbi:MAG: hypothetical protein ACI4JS_06435 [Oscillospiraceae bacterium]